MLAILLTYLLILSTIFTVRTNLSEKILPILEAFVNRKYEYLIEYITYYMLVTVQESCVFILFRDAG